MSQHITLVLPMEEFSTPELFLCAEAGIHRRENPPYVADKQHGHASICPHLAHGLLQSRIIERGVVLFAVDHIPCKESAPLRAHRVARALAPTTHEKQRNFRRDIAQSCEQNTGNSCVPTHRPSVVQHAQVVGAPFDKMFGPNCKPGSWKGLPRKLLNLVHVDSSADRRFQHGQHWRVHVNVRRVSMDPRKGASSHHA